ncbi:MAG: HEPN domain-containing protein [Proteobacteria bacterium]|nr:HEPN domain-containing protein [Pseudomonadota bacterium]
MTTTPTDLLEEARALLTDSAKEVRRRTVCSRAYYAAFHACWKIAGTLGLQRQRDRGAHIQLIQFLGEREERSHQECASLLNDLRIRRNNADYDLETNFPKSIAEDAVADASEIFVGIARQSA